MLIVLSVAFVLVVLKLPVQLHFSVLRLLGLREVIEVGALEDLSQLLRNVFDHLVDVFALHVLFEHFLKLHPVRLDYPCALLCLAVGLRRALISVSALGRLFGLDHSLLDHERVHVDVGGQTTTVGRVAGRAIFKVLLGLPVIFHFTLDLVGLFILLRLLEVAGFILSDTLCVLSSQLVEFVDVHFSDRRLVVMLARLNGLSLVVDSVGRVVIGRSCAEGRIVAANIFGGLHVRAPECIQTLQSLDVVSGVAVLFQVLKPAHSIS